MTLPKPRTMFDDVLDVQLCIKILQNYKLGKIDETECLIKLAECYELLR